MTIFVNSLNVLFIYNCIIIECMNVSVHTIIIALHLDSILILFVHVAIGTSLIHGDVDCYKALFNYSTKYTQTKLRKIRKIKCVKAHPRKLPW